MRKKLHVYTGKRHDVCCGMVYPVDEMTTQEGLFVCLDGCYDDLTPKYRHREIEAVLRVPHREGADTRQEYRTHYTGWAYQEG